MCIGKTQNALFGAIRDNEPTLQKFVNINLIIDWFFEQNPEILNG